MVILSILSHQCGSGLILGFGVMWVDFDVGSLPSAPRDFSRGTCTPVSPSPQKQTLLLALH